MTKSQTVWSNSSKNTDIWVATTRNTTSWANEASIPASYAYSDSTLTYTDSVRTYISVTAMPPNQSNNRNATAWTSNTKNASTWSNESMVLTPYLYDSPTITYDNTYVYDYLQMVTNQSNNKNPTNWTQS